MALTVSVGLTAGVEQRLRADWPQLLGPNRDGQVTLTAPLATDWPAQLPIRWRAGLGSGFGGSAIVGERVLTMHRLDDHELLSAHALADGSQLWECSWPATYQGRMNPDEGPRCVPVVQNGKAFCYGAAGDLVCVQLSDGQLVWHRPLRQELKAEDGYFGAGSTPLAVDDLVLVCLGGKTAGVVAVEQSTGQTRWTATEHDASYASPIAIPTAAGTLALVVTRLETLLLEAATGKVLSSVRFGSRGPTVNAATPIPLENHQYFLTASYGVGSLTLALDDSRQLVEVSRNQALSSQYNTPVSVGSRILGIDGREDVGVASLKALDTQTQQTVWEQAEFGTAHLLAADRQVLALSLDGRLNLIDGQADRFLSLASGRLPTGTYRAVPAMTGNYLVVRRNTSARQSEILCVELP